jgi:hypothetical protein
MWISFIKQHCLYLQLMQFSVKMAKEAIVTIHLKHQYTVTKFVGMYLNSHTDHNSHRKWQLPYYTTA